MIYLCKQKLKIKQVKHTEKSNTRYLEIGGNDE